MRSLHPGYKITAHPAGERFALRKAKLEIADGQIYVVV